MATELGDMVVLELDELWMIEKLVLAHTHLRLQQWRFACYHPQCCDRSSPCRCGARLPFGGVKVVLAGDFGQLPPVAVKDERTLLHGTGSPQGRTQHGSESWGPLVSQHEQRFSPAAHSPPGWSFAVQRIVAAPSRCSTHKGRCCFVEVMT